MTIVVTAAARADVRDAGRLTALVTRSIRLFCAVLLIGYACLITASILPLAFGWSSSVVTSGSMQPSFVTGDVVLSSPARHADVVPGRVILFDDPARPGEQLMHRFVGARSDGLLLTRGDANRTIDSTPISAADVHGVPRLRVPWVGLPVVWWQHGAYVPVAALMALLMTAAWTVARKPPVAPTVTREKPKEAR